MPRRGDTLTRHRSDEFAVLLPDINDLEDTRAIAGKILLGQIHTPVGEQQVVSPEYVLTSFFTFVAFHSLCHAKTALLLPCLVKMLTIIP